MAEKMHGRKLSLASADPAHEAASHAGASAAVRLPRAGVASLLAVGSPAPSSTTGACRQLPLPVPPAWPCPYRAGQPGVLMRTAFKKRVVFTGNHITVQMAERESVSPQTVSDLLCTARHGKKIHPGCLMLPECGVPST